jgi:hypothetical protein
MNVQQAAIHKAGHAVAFARLFGDSWRPRHKLTIETDRSEVGVRVADELTQTGMGEALGEMLRDVESDAIYACAGFAATLVAGYSAPDAEGGCGSDFDAATHLSDLPLDEIKSKAVELLERPENVAAVTRLSRELLECGTLDPTEVEMIIDVSDGLASEDDLARCRTLVR